MKEPFLHDVAKHILTQNAAIGQLLVLIPNKRTGFFIQKYLSEISGKAIVSPEIVTLGAFLQKQAGLTVPDDFTLLSKLYASYIKITQKSLSFDNFYSLGQIILEDFNQIDANLVDLSKLFRNISDLTEIEHRFFHLTNEQVQVLRKFWSVFTPEKISKDQERLLELWKHLPEIYNDFISRLSESKIAFEGYIVRYVAENFDLEKFRNKRRQVFVVGFNACTVAEIRIFDLLKSCSETYFFWDADKYYIQDKNQEAGFFLRNNIERFRNFNKSLVHNNLIGSPKNIELIGVPLEIAQAKILKEILLSINIKFNEKTAIILANENLLLPVLHSLPPEVQKINISMGLNVSNTSIFNFIAQYFSLLRYAKGIESDNPVFYYKEVLSILRKPEIIIYHNDAVKQFINELLNKNLAYISLSKIKILKDNFLLSIFKPIKTIEELFTNLLSILFTIFTNYQNYEKEEFKNKIELESIYHIYLQINRLKDIFINEQLYSEGELEFILRLLKQHLSGINIPFSGEPIEGLQIMGLMETRNLDFENVIILGLNEGIFPDINRPPTLIPENLRYGYGLPVLKHKDSIYAYIFYRLMQRAENIWLIYNNITGNNNGEISRFVKQLLYETGLKITTKQFRQQLVPSVPYEITIKKEGDVLEKLQGYFTQKSTGQYLTATSINCYINCPLQFYFKYIAQIKEPVEIKEEIDSALFGRILHLVMELFYIDFSKERKLITTVEIKNRITKIDNIIDSAFMKELKVEPGDKLQYTGNQIIIKEIIKKSVLNILKYDENYTPFEMLDLEGSNYLINFELNHQENYSVRISGIIDRIDKKDNIIRIIDYKSGNVTFTFSNINSLFSRETVHRNYIALQTFLYGMLYKKKNPAISLFPGIYSIRGIGTIDYTEKFEMVVNSKQRDVVDEVVFERLLIEFEENLNNLLIEMFNSQIPFSQSNHLETCQYCSYAVICNRQQRTVNY